MIKPSRCASLCEDWVFTCSCAAKIIHRSVILNGNYALSQDCSSVILPLIKAHRRLASAFSINPWSSQERLPSECFCTRFCLSAWRHRVCQRSFFHPTGLFAPQNACIPDALCLSSLPVKNILLSTAFSKAFSPKMRSFENFFLFAIKQMKAYNKRMWCKCVNWQGRGILE